MKFPTSLRAALLLLSFASTQAADTLPVLDLSQEAHANTLDLRASIDALAPGQYSLGVALVGNTQDNRPAIRGCQSDLRMVPRRGQYYRHCRITNQEDEKAIPYQ